ncbi:hypothetical protein [Sphingobium sp. TKS]|uniref:hypothetical protein n=1 Tax=Sphingobium sp. TKS TaxID=1315974 RepID=UPI000AB6541A|nr:hypothetical protein [Sphingobium sp. TKS]
MIDYLFDHRRLLTLGRAALQGTQPAFWSKLDASVAIAFALIDGGEGNADRIVERSHQLPPSNPVTVKRMLGLLCGDDLMRHLWRQDGNGRLTLLSAPSVPGSSAGRYNQPGRMR